MYAHMRLIPIPVIPDPAPVSSADRRSAPLRVCPGATARPNAGSGHAVPHGGGAGDCCVFRTEVFDALWKDVVVPRASLMAGPITPEIRRRLWLNGISHLRASDPRLYRSTAHDLERAIAILTPVIGRIEADLQPPGGTSENLGSGLDGRRRPPTAATLARWLREDRDGPVPILGLSSKLDGNSRAEAASDRSPFDASGCVKPAQSSGC